MIYFSEVRRRKVFTEDKVYLGKLDDIIFLALDTPHITKFVIRDNKNKDLIIPMSFIKKLSPVIEISKNYSTEEIAVNELFILRNLLDKQIIDLKGNKVVRVNDVIIQDKPSFSISGVDIGAFAILRRLGLENIFHKLSNFGLVKYDSHYLSWADIQPLELSRGKVVLNVNCDKLKNLHPADLADYLEKTNIKNISKIISSMNKEFAAKVISELNPNYQISLLKKISNEKTVKIIELLDIDEAVEILLQLPVIKQKIILNELTPKKKEQIEKIIHLSSTTIGEYISHEFITVKPEDTSTIIISKIKAETSEFSAFNYVYVINENNQLVGVVNLHELLAQPFDTPIYKFMFQNIIVTHLNSSCNMLLRKFHKYHLYELPVVDSNNKIIGVIKRDYVDHLYFDRKKW